MKNSVRKNYCARFSVAVIMIKKRNIPILVRPS